MAYVLYTPFHMIICSRCYLDQKWTISAPAKYKQMNEGNQSDCTYKLDGLHLPSWLCIDLLSLSREFSALVLVSDAKVTILNRNILSLVNQYVSDLIRVLKLNLHTVPQVCTWILIHQDWLPVSLCANVCISFACESSSKQG